MNTHSKSPLRVAAAVAATVGGLLLAGTTSAVTPQPPGHRTVSGIHVRAQTAAPIAHNAAGGRVTFR
jgi:hypothetical protein